MKSTEVLYQQAEAGTELFVTPHGGPEVFLNLSFIPFVEFGTMSALVPFNHFILSNTEFNILLEAIRL